MFAPYEAYLQVVQHSDLGTKIQQFSIIPSVLIRNSCSLFFRQF